MFGALRFYSATRAAGLKPIIGVDLLCSDLDRPSIRLLLLAKNYLGYLAIVKCISNKKTLDKTNHLAINFNELPTENVYCLAGSHESLGNMLIHDETNQHGLNWIAHLKCKFGDALFLEIQRPGKPNDNLIIEQIDKIAAQNLIPLVATHPAFFPEQKDFFSHEVRVCDKNGQIIHDRNRPRNYTPHQHYLKQATAQDIFSDFPDALANSIEIASASGKSLNISCAVACFK